MTFLINNVKGPPTPSTLPGGILANVEAEPVKVGASIGIALSVNMHERVEDLIRDADGAMYEGEEMNAMAQLTNESRPTAG